MSFRLAAKRWLEDYGSHGLQGLRHVPFGVRLGPTYTRFRREARVADALTRDEVEQYTFERLSRQVQRVYQTNTFYRQHWQHHGFEPRKLRTLGDLQRIPVVTKDDLRDAEFSSRSFSGRGTIPVNTGGSTGTPLAFTVDAGAFAREWAHMHELWSRLGFKYSDGRLTIRGHALKGRGYRYNPAHHEYQVDLQVPVRPYAAQLQTALQRDRIGYIHGYPSAIAAFLREADTHAPALVEHLRKTIKGVLLGSEFPHPHYRDFITSTLNSPTISWYGHSEMAVLAFERDEPFRYHTMPSYGLAESVVRDEREPRLLATSFHNSATPFVRYDTGDLIDDVDEEAGIVRSFKVSQGRVGEFLRDRAGRRIPLTGLIFGRHHQAFAHASHVQLHQPGPGKVDIYVTPIRGDQQQIQWDRLFDFSGVDVTTRFFSLASPVRTPSGKIPLMLSIPPDRIRSAT